MKHEGFQPFTQGVHIMCEFREWDAANCRSRVCADEAKKYVRKDGQRFTILEGGKIKECSKKVMRLCDYHYSEVSKIVALQEANDER